MTPSPTPSRARVLVTATSAAIGGSLAWWHWRGPWLATVAILTVSLFLLALAVPRAYAPVFRVLDGIVQGILRAVTWVLLGIVFVTVFVPGRILLALRGRDLLDRRPAPDRASAWHEVRSTRDVVKHFRAQS